MMLTISGTFGVLCWLRNLCSSLCLLGIKCRQCRQATLAKTLVVGGYAHYTRIVDYYALGTFEAYVCCDLIVGWLITSPHSRKLIDVC